MRRKRELRMQVHKVTPVEGEATQSEDNQTIEKIIQLVPKILVGTVVAVYGYVILDTWRQVTVAQNTYDQEG